MEHHSERFPGNNIHPTAVIGPNVTMGVGNYIGPYCVIGMPGEHRGKWGEDKGVHILHGATITGMVTIDSGIEKPTFIGMDVFIMKHAHVGHDAHISHGVTISCGAKIGGHTSIGDNANIGLNAVIHQNHDIGAWAMIGMGAVVPLKVQVEAGRTYVGNPARCIGVNKKAPVEVFGTNEVTVKSCSKADIKQEDIIKFNT